MRLLQVQEDGSLSLVERVGNNIPRYAILSHTWGPDEDEVTFVDIMNRTGQFKKGYRKLRFCGKQAAKDNLQYFWVDTCCIDKTSSAELTEAINSMFRWYQDSARCYVFLPDVSIGDEDEFSKRWKTAFRRSRWFTRGWTLQELIAPSSVEFFSKEELRLGDKRSLEQTIHEITKIAIHALRGHSISNFSEAERMSWAAKRETKREEDAAYCLLGIFDVHMPLIYGEGKRNAMKRLQKEFNESQMSLEVEQQSIIRQDTPQMSIAEELGVPDLQFELDQLDYDRCPNTGVWLVDNPAYVEFTKDRSPASFHLCGNPGSGKTFLLSKIVCELREYTIAANGTALTFFLCDGKSEAYNRRTSLAVLKSITAQLLEKIMNIDAAFARSNVEALVLVRRKAKEVPEGQLFNILTKCLRYFTECYIVVDAVDECDDWENMLRIFTRLVDVNATRLKFFLSSQKVSGIPYIISRLPVATKFRVDVTGPAVESDIGRYVDWRVRTLDLRNLGSPDEARESLVHGSDGLFLLAKLRLDILSKQILPISTNIRAAISELPTEIFPLYERLLARLDDSQKSIAQVLFVWITHAQRVLTIEELMEASRIELAANDLAEGRLTEFEIEYLGGGLIEVHEGRVRLAHSTVRDFVALYDWGSLAKISEMNDDDVLNNRLLSNCLNYMTNEQFVSPVISAIQFTSDIQKSWPLAEYMVRHWMGHLGSSHGNVEMVKKVFEFLRSEAGLAWWICYTKQIQLHDWWSLPEISADIHDWFYKNRDVYRSDTYDVEVVMDLCQRHVSGLERQKFGNKLDLYIPALLRLAEQKLEYGYNNEAKKIMIQAVTHSERVSSAHGDQIRLQAKLDFIKVLRYDGLYEEAMQHCESLQAELEILGNKFSRQQTVASQTLGLIAGESGQMEQSEAHLRRLMETTKDTLSSNDPDRLAVVHGVAWVCYNRGNFREAESLWDIDHFKTVLGKHHPSTLTIMECVAHLKRSQGDYDGSRQMLVDVHRLRQSRQGPRSVDTIRSEIGLAYCARSPTDISRAAESIRDLLKTTTERFSDDHFLTLELKAALAELFRLARELDSALNLQTEIVEKRVQTLGERHISTINEKLRIAIIRLDQSKFDEAETVLTEIRTIRMEDFATDYRGLCSVVGCLTRLKRTAGKLHESEALAYEALELAGKCEEEENPDSMVALTDLAILKRRQGHVEEAYRLHEQVIQLRLRTLPRDHPEVLNAMGNLAITKGQGGRNEEALEIEEQILELRQKKMPGDHPDVLIAMANLAITKRKQDQLQEAEELELKVLECRKKTMNEDNPSLLQAMGNLAITRGRRGHDKEAEEMEEQVLSNRLKIMPPSHPDVLIAMGNLAITKRRLKNLKEAIRLEEQVLAYRKETMDEDNPEVLNAMSNLAVSKSEQAQYREAQEIEEKVLEFRMQTLPENHPDLLTSMANLAITLRRQSKYTEAKKLQQEVLEIRRRNLSESSPDVLNAMANLALTMSESDEHEAAAQLEEQIVNVRVRNGMDALDAKTNLAITKRRQAKYQEAQRLEEEVLETRLQTLDRSHADVLLAMANLAVTKRRQGKYHEAMELQQEVLDRKKAFLDEDDAGVLNSMANLAATKRDCGQLAEAQSLEERVLELRRQTLDADNPDVLDALSNLAVTVATRKDSEYTLRLYKEVVSKTENAYGPEHVRTIRSKLGLANAYDDVSDPITAERVFRDVTDTSTRVLGEDNVETLYCYYYLGEFLMCRFRNTEARVYCEKALNGRIKLYGEDHEETLSSVGSIANLHAGMDDMPEAERLYKKVLEGRKRVLGEGHALVFTTANLVGLTLARQTKYKEAEIYHKEALQGREDLFGMHDRETLETLGDLVFVLGLQRKLQEEGELRARFGWPVIPRSW